LLCVSRSHEARIYKNFKEQEMFGLSMKGLFRRAAGAGAVLGALGMVVMSPASGQVRYAPRGSFHRVPQNVQPAYGSGAGSSFRQIGQESPQPYEPPPVTQAPPPLPAAEPYCDPPAAEDEPWGLTDIFDDACGNNWMKDCGWKIGGSTVSSVTLNTSSPRDRFNGPVTWLDRSNEWQLNQQWLYLERATDTSCNDWDIGGRVDFLYGTNYRWSTSAGLEDQWRMNTDRSFYGLAMPSAYVETAYRDVKVKWGHFISPVGFCTLDTTLNPTPFLPYTYQYGEAFTHWGAIATWNATDAFVLGGGITAGWDNFDGSGVGSRNAGWIGTATYTFEDKSSIAYVGLWSNEFNNVFLGTAPQFSSRYLQTLVYSRPIGDKLTYVAQTDFGTQDSTFDFSGTRDIGTARWYGLNQYLMYAATDKLTLVGNFEWFRDESGFRVGALLPTATTPGSSVRGLPGDRFGYEGNFYQLTLGAKYMPTKNLFLRPFVRFDWFEGNSLNTGALRPFADGTRKDQVLIGGDVGLVY
jgi:hypothetical protein